MKKILYVLNDCMRKFSYERAAGLYRALQQTGEPFGLYILRSDAYYGFAAEHNYGEYNIYRLPDYGEFDGILLDVNSIFSSGNDGMQYAVYAAAAAGKPVLSMANHIPGFHYVGIDNYRAMQSVIRHLHVEKGLTDFWFALGPADNYENQARTKGLKDYCAAKALPCGEERFYAESFIIECGIHAFDALLARHGGRLPQAVICANDHIALGVCHAARAAGHRVPEDFLVTGFDNTSLAAAHSPAITSVDQQCWRMGDVCVDALRSIWNGESVPEVITTPTALVLRQSTNDASPAPEHDASEAADAVDSALGSADFSYKMSAMRYRLPGCRSIEEICQALAECFGALNCDGLDLILDDRLNDPDRTLSFSGDTGHMNDITGGLRVDGYPDTLKWVFSWDKGGEARFPGTPLPGTLSALPLKGSRGNYLFAPLHFMEYTVGYLCVRNCLDLMRIKGVSDVVSTLTMALRAYYAARNLAYINHVLSGVSMRDGLTGLYNRLGYHELAYPLYRELMGSGRRLAIVFIDMDRLKHINDVYGHGAGDEAIGCVASAIRDSLPPDAIPVRYGGDEFLVLVPDGAEAAVTRLISAVEAAIDARSEALGLPETPGVSTGFVIASPSGGKALDDYVREADARMYQAKRAKKAGLP